MEGPDFLLLVILAGSLLGLAQTVLTLRAAYRDGFVKVGPNSGKTAFRSIDPERFHLAVAFNCVMLVVYALVLAWSGLRVAAVLL